MSFTVVDAPQWKLEAQSPILSIEEPAKYGYVGSMPSRAYCSFCIPSRFNKTVVDFTIAYRRMNLGKFAVKVRV